MSKLFDNAQLVAGFIPTDMQTAANNGDYVTMKNYNKCAIIFYKAIGTAGDDPTITVQQATTVAGGSVKALNFTTIKVKQGADLAAVAQFTNTTQVAANTYTDATSAELAAIWVIEFDASELDVAGGFDCLRATVADIGGNPQLGCLLYILSSPRYADATMVGAIAD